MAITIETLRQWFDGETVCPPCLIGNGSALADWSCDALAAIVGGKPLPDPYEYASEPEAPFYVVIDHEQTAAECPTLEAARIEGRKLADAEPIPCTFSIQDSNGQHVEDVTRTDGRTLAELVKAFDAAHPKRG